MVLCNDGYSNAFELIPIVPAQPIKVIIGNPGSLMTIMKMIAFLATLLFTLNASAIDSPRCGRDLFGNEVCMDKDGVLTNAPKKSVRPKVDDGNRNVNTGTKEQTDSKTESNDAKSNVRCGIDSFGNKVCL
jgi:hypothetical protein